MQVTTWGDNLLCSQDSLIYVCSGEVLSEQILTPQFALLLSDRLSAIAASKLYH